MKYISFSEYMKQFEDEDSERGMLARDIRDFPLPELATLRESVDYIRNKYFAPKEVIKTMKDCYKEYKKAHAKDYNWLFVLRRAARELEGDK